MVTYLKHMDSKVVGSSAEKGVGSRKKTLARKRTGGKDSEESVKKQKLEDDTEKEELKAYLDIVPGDEIAMEVESLATKSDRSSKNYKIFIEMLNDFDRQDVMDLHRLKKYPLTQEMLSRMLSRRLKVDHESEMASELLSVPIPNVAYEDVFKEWDDRVVRATTTAASLDATQASGDRPMCQEAMAGFIPQTRSERASKHSYDPPLPGGNTPRSDDERIEQDDLTDFVLPTPHDLPLSGGYTPGSDEDLVIRKLKKKVRKLEKKLRARILGMKLIKIGTSKRKSLDDEYVSKQGRKSDKKKPMFDDSDFVELDVDNAMKNVEVNTASIDVSVAGPSNVSTTDPSISTAGDIFKDEMMTIIDTLVAIRSTRPRTTSVIISWDVEEEPSSQLKHQTANLSFQDKGKALWWSHKNFFKEMEPIKNFDNNVHASMEAYALLAIGETSGSGEEQSAEKEKELSEEELQKLLVVVPLEEVYVEALQVKYLVIDWEVYSEDTRRYWRIIIVGNHTEAYQIFADMLKKFDRDDLVKLWDLVKKRFSIIEPTDDKEKELWVKLKRLFNPDNDDIMWKLQRYMQDPLVWRFYDTCGVHYVSLVRGHDIFMLIEKEYPLTRGTLGLMMVARLLVEADSEMSRELLRKIFYQANRRRQ
ncbi:hypothetical protein Tco_0558924 [Tanacetum coccineum]